MRAAQRLFARLAALPQAGAGLPSAVCVPAASPAALSTLQGCAPGRTACSASGQPEQAAVQAAVSMRERLRRAAAWTPCSAGKRRAAVAAAAGWRAGRGTGGLPACRHTRRCRCLPSPPPCSKCGPLRARDLPASMPAGPARLALQQLPPLPGLCASPAQQPPPLTAQTAAARWSPDAAGYPAPDAPSRPQGNIAAWKKKEGQEVAAGDVLCEVETDKVSVRGMPARLPWALLQAWQCLHEQQHAQAHGGSPCGSALAVWSGEPRLCSASPAKQAVHGVKCLTRDTPWRTG